MSGKRKAKVVPDDGPFKKKRQDLTVNEVGKVREATIEEAKDISRKHNIMSTNQLITRKDSKKIQEKWVATSTMSDHIESLNKLNMLISKKKKGP